VAAISPEQWQEVSPYLDHALSLSQEDRNAWLESFSAERPDLAGLMQKLLEHHLVAAQESFLEQQPSLPIIVSTAGQIIGPYTLISLLGQGGMGTVWLAERSDGRFERRVAIKFLRFSVATQGGAERFKREGKILGQLSHPHIAELMDAGVTLTGEPYLVLEYVEGEPIDCYCDNHHLDIESRIRILLDVLSAVAHAHASLVVHRDLKPSNIFVRNDCQVKLLDFGIAKLLGNETGSADATLLTLEGGGAITPQFAAPEQITGAAITTATDVYALGIVLYMLFTGQHPVGNSTRSAAELVKAITETEPLRVSNAAASCAEAEAVARDRSATPDKLHRQLRGDLDTIVAKALKKTPHERYPSSQALADDLQRYLGHEPISARPDTFAYRARKFIRRNRVAAALSAFALLALGAGVAGTLIQAHTARLQRDAALRERDRAQRITDFTIGMFKVSDPSEKVGNAVTAREVLDKASNNIANSLSKDPDLQAQMMHVMGKAYSSLGLHQRAQALFEQSIRAGTSAAGPENPENLVAMRDLAWSLFQQGHLADAEALQRKVIDTQRRVLGPENIETVNSVGNLADILIEQGKNTEGETLHREVIAKKKRLLGPEAQGTLSAMDNLAVALARSGKLPEAAKLEEETLAIQIHVAGRENLSSISCMINLAAMNMDMGRSDQAEKQFRQALDLERHVLGPDQPETALTAYNLAEILALQNRPDEALSLLRQAVDHGLHPRIDLKIEKEPDFRSLRGDPRFVALVADAKQRAAGRSSD
jgi:serine/threonine protein kinase